MYQKCLKKKKKKQSSSPLMRVAGVGKLCMIKPDGMCREDWNIQKVTADS